MSDLWLNFRVWVYHVQAGRREWWRVSISRNDYHRNNPDSTFIQLYDLSWPRSYTGGHTASKD